MARIAGVNIPDNKRVVISLTYILGIGNTTSAKILKQLKIDPNIRVKDLAAADIETIKGAIEKDYKVEGDLRSEIASHIRRLKDIASYRGTRHTKKLPLRGQRTRTNARTKRGKKVTVGSGRKKSSEKT
jgi:small subunit ribosomal protein S13